MIRHIYLNRSNRIFKCQMIFSRKQIRSVFKRRARIFNGHPTGRHCGYRTDSTCEHIVFHATWTWRIRWRRISERIYSVKVPALSPSYPVHAVRGYALRGHYSCCSRRGLRRRRRWNGLKARRGQWFGSMRAYYVQYGRISGPQRGLFFLFIFLFFPFASSSVRGY
jgi:hypothetical protein